MCAVASRRVFSGVSIINIAPNFAAVPLVRSAALLDVDSRPSNYECFVTLLTASYNIYTTKVRYMYCIYYSGGNE